MRRHEASSGERIEARDPSDVRKVVGEVPAMTGADVAEPYDRAEEGARLWRETPALVRGGVLAGAARLLAERLEEIAVNLPTSGWDVHMPFGGFRESGSAFKEQGLDALRFSTRTKTIAVRYGG